MFRLVAVYLLLTCITSVPGQTGPGLSCVCLEELDQPRPIRTATSISNANDGSGRLFVTELIGGIWIYQANGSRMAEPFADLSDTVVIAGSTGLLSLAFHPDHSNNGLAYIYGTLNSSTGDFYNSVVEYRVSQTDSNKLDLSSKRIVFQIKCGGPGDCHNGGAVC